MAKAVVVWMDEGLDLLAPEWEVWCRILSTRPTILSLWRIRSSRGRELMMAPGAGRELSCLLTHCEALARDLLSYSRCCSSMPHSVGGGGIYWLGSRSMLATLCVVMPTLAFLVGSRSIVSTGRRRVGPEVSPMTLQPARPCELPGTRHRRGWRRFVKQTWSK
jgi:hypothetical protein